MILPPRMRAAMAAPLLITPEWKSMLEAGFSLRPSGLDLAGLLRRARSGPGDLAASGKPLAAWLPAPAGVREYGWTPQYEARLADHVALIDIEGLLVDRAGWCRASQCWFDGYDEILASMRAASAHEDVHAIFMRINSPGGMSFGLFEAVEEIASLSARHGGKPIVCHVQGYGASAAYALAAACDEVHAMPSARIGSIGAIQLHHDVSGAMDRAGIKVTAVAFGKRKTDGSEHGPLSETALANWQAHIGELGTRFVSAIARLRSLPEADILGQEAELYSTDNADPAFSALKRGLIDSIADEAGAFARARELAEAWKAGQGEGGALPVPAPSPTPPPALAAITPKPDTKGNSMTRPDNGGGKARLSALLETAEKEEMSAEDILAAIRALVNDEAEAASDDEAASETEEEEAQAASGEDEAGAETDDEASAAASAAAAAPSAQTVLAIMALPVAQKNVALAADIAGLPGMTVEKAKGILAKAGGKGFPGSVPDPDVKSDGARAAVNDLDSFADQAVALAGVGVRK